MQNSTSERLVNRVVELSALWFAVDPFCVRHGDRRGSKTRSVGSARHVAQYVLWHHFRLSYHVIGRLFGQADHTSATYACRKIQNLLASEDIGGPMSMATRYVWDKLADLAPGIVLSQPSEAIRKALEWGES